MPQRQGSLDLGDFLYQGLVQLEFNESLPWMFHHHHMCCLENRQRKLPTSYEYHRCWWPSSYGWMGLNTGLSSLDKIPNHGFCSCFHCVFKALARRFSRCATSFHHYIDFGKLEIRCARSRSNLINSNSIKAWRALSNIITGVSILVSPMQRK
jgi:hypothetical protein